MSTFRFIHTSDVHLDTSFSGAGFTPAQGQVLRAEIRAAFRRIIDAALSEDVDALLIAGDLYEADRVTPDTVQFLEAQFRRLGARPVVIAPGNHDPYTQTSPYHQHAWPENVRIFRSDEPQSFDLGGAQAHGLEHLRPDEQRNLLQTLRAAPGNAAQLAILHASDAPRVPGAKRTFCPFEQRDLEGRGFRYVALGHYHRCYRVDADSPGDGAWYSGCPQARGFDEPEDCSFLLVSVQADRVEVSPQPSGGKRFISGDLDCSDFDHSAAVSEAIRAWIAGRQAQRDVVRLRLVGDHHPTMRLELAGLIEECRGAAFQLTLRNALRPAYDLEALAREDSLRGAFARALSERLTTCDDAERPIIERAVQFGVEAFADRDLLLS